MGASRRAGTTDLLETNIVGPLGSVWTGWSVWPSTAWQGHSLNYSVIKEVGRLSLSLAELHCLLPPEPHTQK